MLLLMLNMLPKLIISQMLDQHLPPRKLVDMRWESRLTTPGLLPVGSSVQDVLLLLLLLRILFQLVVLTVLFGRADEAGGVAFLGFDDMQKAFGQHGHVLIPFRERRKCPPRHQY